MKRNPDAKPLRQDIERMNDIQSSFSPLRQDFNEELLNRGELERRLRNIEERLATIRNVRNRRVSDNS